MRSTGTYSLASINGRPVPTVWRQATGPAGGRVRSLVLGGRAVLRSDGRYTMSLRRSLGVLNRVELIGPVAADGHWRLRPDGVFELYSEHGMVGEVSMNADSSVMVARCELPLGTREVGLTVLEFRRDEVTDGSMSRGPSA